MDNRISSRQAGAWGFCALSVPAVLTCAGLGWGWAFLGCAAVCIYFYLTRQLAGGAVCLTKLTMQAFGMAAGRIILALGGTFALLAAAQTAAKAGLAFADETARIAGPAVLALAVLANETGARQAARACGALFLLLAGLYTIILLAAAKSVEISWLSAWGGARQTLKVIPAMLVLSCLRFLPQEEGGKRGIWYLTLLFVPSMMAAITAGCLSPRLTQQLELPFYTVSQSLSVLDVMERFEPLVSAALFMGFFAMTSLLLAASRAQWEAAIPASSAKKQSIVVLGALALGASLLTGRINENLWALGAAVCWGIWPLLTQLIVAIK